MSSGALPRVAREGEEEDKEGGDGSLGFACWVAGRKERKRGMKADGGRVPLPISSIRLHMLVESA